MALLEKLFRPVLRALEEIFLKNSLPALAFPSFEVWDHPPKTEVINDGFLWIPAPKKRTSVEKRLTRKVGRAVAGFQPRKNILTCNVCGHFHLAHTICGNCYDKVKRETETLQKEIISKLGLDPVEKEIKIIYTDDVFPEEKDVLLIEPQRPRPPWFSKNLMSKGNSDYVPSITKPSPPKDN